MVMVAGAWREGGGGVTCGACVRVCVPSGIAPSEHHRRAHKHHGPPRINQGRAGFCSIAKVRRLWLSITRAGATGATGATRGDKAGPPGCRANATTATTHPRQRCHGLQVDCHDLGRRPRVCGAPTGTGVAICDARTLAALAGGAVCAELAAQDLAPRPRRGAEIHYPARSYTVHEYRKVSGKRSKGLCGRREIGLEGNGATWMLGARGCFLKRQVHHFRGGWKRQTDP